ncbi:hypothetical protein BLNAU_21932 [Blattamonas nauphoetae]|uniref:ABC transmembrane type-1 domain-containing protein n=1 Tax=Blattamonas nauphoetae TaxID=2049346 RepID=A0ABQ9WVM4_9EUKA|nr:hypothetical protein BLNAU_21932 [Blattamonas nauphoetae]
MQGMRVVHYSGLEDVFIDRIEDKLNNQVRWSVRMATWLFISSAIVHSIPAAMNNSVIFLLVVTRWLAESEFAVFLLLPEMKIEERAVFRCVAVDHNRRRRVQMGRSAYCSPDRSRTRRA